MNATISLSDYLNKNKTFVIPDYQRGYIWGKNNNKTDSVSNLMDSLINAFQNNADFFLQGITVTETDKTIILIDGQQRTTCLYLLLKSLDYDKPFIINYSIREQSNKFLTCISSETDVTENTEEDFQDVYFFKKTLRIIHQKIPGKQNANNDEKIDNKDFLNYLLNKVKFLYINIPQEKARTVFTMMNGNKAEMLPEEIIKAELLRVASINMDNPDMLTENERNAIEWDKNMLRSRYAREWDKWLYWWNRDDVKELFRCSNPMGLLISTYLQRKKGGKLTFNAFKKKCLMSGSEKEAKDTFDGLRCLQKRFEDSFNDPITYNRIGAIIQIMQPEDAFIKYFFAEDNRTNLEKYYKCVFLGMTHSEIEKYINGTDTDKFDEKYQITYKELDDDYLYKNNSDAAFKLLLRMNIDEDNKQNDGKGRKFDFSIWKEKSLEHIFPKSKVYHIDKEKQKLITGDEKEFPITHSFGNDYLNQNDIYTTRDGTTVTTTEHSIGNLVLLYKNENSAFSNSSVEDKKAMFFNPGIKAYFNSRHLLNTIYIFAKSTWNGQAIAENKIDILNKFKEYYEK